MVQNFDGQNRVQLSVVKNKPKIEIPTLAEISLPPFRKMSAAELQQYDIPANIELLQQEVAWFFNISISYVSQLTGPLEAECPPGYIRERKKYISSGIRELMIFNLCCSENVIARYEDWDIAARLGLVEGSMPEPKGEDPYHLCKIIRDANEGPLLIPSKSPDEVKAIIQDMDEEEAFTFLGRVKVNRFKIGKAKYERLRRTRWQDYCDQNTQAVSAEAEVEVVPEEPGGSLATLQSSEGITKVLHPKKHREVLDRVRAYHERNEQWAASLEKNIKASKEKGIAVGFVEQEAFHIGRQEGKSLANEVYGENPEDAS